jgi:hypothetical protein
MSYPKTDLATIQRLHYLLAEMEKFDKWRKEALATLLNDFAPRIHKLGTQFYSGCGFHYSKVQSLGRLIVDLAIPWQICMNHQNKWDEYSDHMLLMPVLFESLEREIKEAEADVSNTRSQGHTERICEQSSIQSKILT